MTALQAEGLLPSSATAFWHRDFGGAQDVVGKSIRVNLTPVTIIGVNPPNFSGPVAADTSAPEIFLPLSMLTTLFPDPTGVLMDPNTSGALVRSAWQCVRTLGSPRLW
jgi:hypothetical protein